MEADIMTLGILIVILALVSADMIIRCDNE